MSDPFRIASNSASSAPDFQRMRAQIYRHMLQTRGWKYRSFLRFLRLFKYLSFSPTRGSFLEYYYVMMRYLDDVVDGDAPLPEGYQDPQEYMERKISFSKDLSGPRDAVDYLMLHCLGLGERFGQEFQQETEDILHSLLFDAKRRDTWEVFPAATLQEHFHKMDIRGTIRATLKIFGDDPDQYPLLEPLGVACRYQYDIEDVSSDLKAGYVNITREEIESLGIRPEELRDPDSPGIKQWVQKHALEGMKLLEEHRVRVREGNFSPLARATFPVVYGWPARKVFRKILEGNPASDNSSDRL